MIGGSSVSSIPHEPCLPCLKRQTTSQHALNLAGVDELQWQEAMQRAGGEGNARNLWPVLALGTKDLLARKHAQVRLRSVIHTSCCTSCGQLGFGCEVAPIKHSCSLSIIVRVMARVQIYVGTGNISWTSGNAALFHIAIQSGLCASQAACVPLHTMPHACTATQAGCALQEISQAHVLVQDAAMREHRERLASAKQKARQLVRHQDVVLTERVDQVEHLFTSYHPRPTKERGPA